MKKAILFSLAILSFILTRAQQSCTIQANCRQTYTLSAAGKDSVLIYGLVTASDGVKSYTWAQKSGPNTSVLSTPTATQTYVKGLVPGTYIYGFGATTVKGTVFAPVADTLTVYPFVDGIDSVRVYYRSGRIIKQ